MRTFSGVHHGSTTSFSCSGSQSPKPQYRASRLQQEDDRRSRGGAFFAIRNSAFGQYSADRSKGYARQYVPSHWAKVMQSGAWQIANNSRL